MKLNRRMFFGASAGAAMAAPSLAAGLIDKPSPRSLGSKVLMARPREWGSEAEDDVGKSGDWRIGRLAELKKLVSGEEDEADRRSRQTRVMEYLGDAERHRLDSLKSISPSRKVVMLAEGEAARRRRYEVMRAQWELEDLEAQLLKFPWEG